jgi:pentalenolactone synthase
MYRRIERKRRAPAEDVISDLIAAQERGDVSPREAVGYAVNLLLSGHETTVARIDYGTLLLLANPEARERLGRDPVLAEPMVEEILRLSRGNGDGLPRYAREDIEIGGVTIRAGQMVLLSVAAANRDGRIFPDPDTFKADREPNAHLAFGYGSRYCVGAALARVELQTIFGRLPGCFPNLRLAVPWESLRMRAHLLTGGVESLPVAW